MGRSKTEVNFQRLLAAAPQQRNHSKLMHPEIKVSQEPITRNSFKQSPKSDSENHMPSSPGLRRRVVPASNIKDRTHEITEADASVPIKLDAAAEAHIQKHRKLQEDLTDEMVGLAQQLKERSLMMSRSLENTEKILDSTETAIEQSLATTGHTNVRVMKIYSETSKTTCFQWLLMLAMICVFIMVVLLIRVT
ncbi:hypothetical protein ES288_D10G185700v1 [Gossypium darwinii]|uniref:Uncharacterized protein n=1 Tax=Gossypium darwinii TaxID=34276 RepID=A0A5D2B3C3_GOSDA|nr:hypothetical protein ES288_D10G185700v1 [Gossypium darwinii]TYG50573.1 hypothetical protein ES288_D10G185700v1 [Gossypium darwinii]TYG50576.1 hypothetical protein ES288_D10G185700v1 [Gossypium darwinii]